METVAQEVAVLDVVRRFAPLDRDLIDIKDDAHLLLRELQADLAIIEDDLAFLDIKVVDPAKCLNDYPAAADLYCPGRPEVIFQDNASDHSKQLAR